MTSKAGHLLYVNHPQQEHLDYPQQHLSSDLCLAAIHRTREPEVWDGEEEANLFHQEILNPLPPTTPVPSNKDVNHHFSNRKKSHEVMLNCS